MKIVKLILWTLLAVVLGELTLVLLITLVQEVIFGGIDYYTSPWHHILLGGAGTFLAAVVAGYVASRIVRSQHYYAHIILSCLIVLETIYLITTGRLGGPLWFDLAASLSLVIGVWLGGMALVKTNPLFLRIPLE